MKTKKAFTLAEILVVLVIIGILAMIAIANSIKPLTQAEEAQVVSKARELFHAKICYLSETNRRTAETTWSSLTESARYDALKPYLSYAAVDLTTYTTPGYVVTLTSDIHAKPTVVRTADNQAIIYQ